MLTDRQRKGKTMKASMYFNYTSRSLLRGGQRTVLAVFCVAVGVMAIVSLQLAGFMLSNSLTSNTRDANGGDIAVTASLPLKQSDLSYFSRLEHNGTITNYTAVASANGLLKPTAPSSQAFSVSAVDPQNYPIADLPSFVTPGNGSMNALLSNDNVVVTQGFLDRYGKKVGATFNVYIKNMAGTGQTLRVTIDGVVANTGVFAQSGNMVLISQHDFQAAEPGVAPTYSVVDINTVNQAHTNTAVKAIDKHFPLVSTQTVADVLKQQQASFDNINKFLEIAGLLALLIGGVGIVNTMRVLLSRRKTEIAMLKTAGYRRGDLYLLFGLEAGLLGLVGGVVGAAAATGVSYVVRGLMQNFGFVVPFILNPLTIAGGVAIGFLTALIFGLMPIVQAANIRPLNVIRELPESKGASSAALTVGLLVILSILFCVLSIVILNNDVLLGIEAVYGTFAFLLLLSAFFGLVVLIVSKLPVPESLNLKHLAFILIGLVVSALVYLLMPVFGVLLCAASLAGIVIVVLPRSWKVSTKMALRNIGRQRARTTTTMLALFIGVFAVGLILSLGIGLESQISGAFTKNLPYNIIVTTSGTETTAIKRQLHTLPGLTAWREDTFEQVVPVAINGLPVQQQLPNDSDRQTALDLMGSIEGYNLSQKMPALTISAGRNLNASDAGTANVLINQQLSSSGFISMHLKVGDTITFASYNGKLMQTVTVAGIYSGDISSNHIGSVLAPNSLITALSPAKSSITTVTYMNVNAAQVNKTLNRLGTIAPNANVESLADVGAGFAQQLNDVLDLLIAIASLSLLAGAIIIANAVALAMLERRRELGILKSVGYTSGTVLSEVLIENGIIGAVGAFMAMILAAIVVGLLGHLLFSLTLNMSALVAISLIGGSALLAMLIAALVAWGAVRVRPLEVLRYE
jgi:putative ABC transport system permease protein